MKLRTYQEEDVKKLCEHDATACFNEQRTGKTPTSIVAMRTKKVDKLLVVCPASAIYAWCEELQRWGNYNAVPVIGLLPKRLSLIKDWQPNTAMVISYDALKETATRHGCIEELLKQKPDGVIADEAHRFKTPKSAVAKAMFKLIKIPQRIALTGTPAPNKPEEVFSILKFIRPTEFNSYWSFLTDYFEIVNSYASGGRVFKKVMNFKPGKQEYLQHILYNIATQRKRKEVMPWLAPKDIQAIKLPPTAQQVKYLSELQQFFRTGDVNTQGVLDRLIRYRQICLDPGLLNLKGHSPKTDWIVQYIKDYPEKPIVIFSKFTSYLKKLNRTLTECGILSQSIIGETPTATRAQYVKDFQAGSLNILLINIDAGKEALTLDRGECAIFTDAYPPAADIQQAEDRCVTTQECNKDKPYTIVRLQIKDTYDEHIYNMINNNAQAIDVINDFKKYITI